jgi:hypothetical protein
MKVRKNLTMSNEIAAWYEEKAKELGISQSNMMVMALAEYVKQDKTIDVMSNLEEYISRLEQIAPPEKE